jgi:hypothetical protein
VLTTILLTAYAVATTRTAQKPVTETYHGTAVTDDDPARSGTSALLLDLVTAPAGCRTEERKIGPVASERLKCRRGNLAPPV